MARGERDRVGAYRAFYTEVDAALRGTRDALLATVRRASRYDGRAAAYLLSRSFDRVRAARPRRAPNGVSEAIDRMLEGGPAPTTRRAGGE
jgi:hypothetical protein